MTNDPAPHTNPLAEASPQSLDELLSKSPLLIIREDDAAGDNHNVDAIVAALRADRERWRQAEAAGATRAPKPSAKKSPSSLEDLGL